MSKAPLRSWGPSSKQVAPVPARHCWLPGDPRERESMQMGVKDRVSERLPRENEVETDPTGQEEVSSLGAGRAWYAEGPAHARIP